MGPWDVEQVLGLASDPASAKAGQAQARTAKWPETGASERAVWGLCQGSGKQPYQTTVDLSGPAYKCSCPSRKFPCKHALGLLLLWAAGEVRPGDEPEWVTSWVDQRAARAERPERKPGEVADPLAAQQRASRRADRVSAGMAELAELAGRPGPAGARRVRPAGVHRAEPAGRADGGRAGARRGGSGTACRGCRRPRTRLAGRTAGGTVAHPPDRLRPRPARPSCRRRSPTPCSRGSAGPSRPRGCWPRARRSRTTGWCSAG